ncbi:MAG: hypothetical protein EPO57_07400 [Chitinophagaceae bacterium]|nr:MAG: hypothetical protein EPO57_07400 [Chitinophagaceae bacterium]
MQKQKTIFLLSLLVAIFWNSTHLINVYKIAAIGALFEFLWLPMLILLFTMPVISFVLWRKVKFNFRSLLFYAHLISIVTVAQMMLSK